jgi:hypothetical protein
VEGGGGRRRVARGRGRWWQAAEELPLREREGEAVLPLALPAFAHCLLAALLALRGLSRLRFGGGKGGRSPEAAAGGSSLGAASMAAADGDGDGGARRWGKVGRQERSGKCASPARIRTGRERLFGF